MGQGLRLIHSNRPEALRDFLVSWMRRHPLAGLENETILVQSNGVAQWLKLGLAENPAADGGGGLGIAACLDLSLPSRFVWQAYRAVLGSDAVPDTSAFDKERLVWRFMRLLSSLPQQSQYLPLVRFLGPGRDPLRCYQLAQQVADLFDQYQVYRADWLNAWAEGRDVIIHADRRQSPIAAADLWQPALWRSLLGDVGPEGQTSRATVHQAFLEKVYGSAERLAGLPSRLFVFGVSALPRQSLEVLQAIAKCSEVFVCVHNPCREDWSEPTHTLLSAWGKQGRDYMGLLQATEEPRIDDRYGQPSQRIDLFESPGRDSLLHQLQDDILRGQTHDGLGANAADRSIVFHQSHSPQRELEVLHDQLLDAFDRDKTLQPRDIVVMVPDINAYAPVIEAVFGQHAADDPRRIPYSITDRVLSQQLPMAQALDFLLTLTEARCTASELMALLGVPAVRHRIGLPEAQLPLLGRWIRESNIRWALDASHRGAFAGHAVDQNTWVFGLERMLLGYAVGDSFAATSQTPLWQDVSPYAEVSGLEASCVGSLALLIAAMRDYRARLAEPAAPGAWAALLAGMLGDFFTPQSNEEKAFLLQAQSALLDWQQDCSAAKFDAPIPLSVVRSEWQARIAQQQFAQRFFAGRVSFATLMPMRAIPFRMVCLLGLNDGEFPRSRSRVDFDLMRHDQRPGDRSRRDDDRYLFLEALVSARDTLYISWIGKSPVDDSDRAPSVLVGQLRDHIDDAWAASATPSARETRLSVALTQGHRLQPFHPAYFPLAGSPGADRWFTYAREWQAVDSGAVDPAHWAGQRLPLPFNDSPDTSKHSGATTQVRLTELTAFLKEPAAVFFKERLKVSFGEARSVAEDDEETFLVAGLHRFAQEQALLDACYQAFDQKQPLDGFLDQTMAQIRAAGELPVGAARDTWMAEALLEVRALFARYEALRLAFDGPAREVRLAVSLTAVQEFSLGNGLQLPVPLTLVDHIDQCFCLGNEGMRIVVTPRRLRDEKGTFSFEKLVGFWVEHLALQVAAGEALGCVMTTRVLGLNADVSFAPIDLGRAQQLLADLGTAYCEALCRPLPLAARTGFAWLSASSDKSEKPEKPGSDHEFAGLTPKSTPKEKPWSDPGFPAWSDPKIVKVVEAYEGNPFLSTPSLGEVDRSPYLARAYPSFAALVQDGSFFTLCTRLYGPVKALAQVIPVRQTKQAKAEAV
nr:RecBCD enzyme subunit RecC [Cupriavidus sp.]